jgi:ATP-dependent Zn protease
MAYAEESTRVRGSINEHASALAHEWRRLTRAATAVALLTAPAFFLVLYDSNHISLAGSLIITLLAVGLFRGMIEVLVRKWIPWPSLYNAEEGLKEDDLVARRRYWYWRSKFRRLPILIILVVSLLAFCQVLFAFAGVSAGFFHPFQGLRQIFPPDTLPQLALVFIQLPLLLFINVFILFGPFLFMAARGIRSYEPGDASWGVKIDDVRGQAEAKEEITRVITLWQSGEEFEKAGGKRERGLLFLGAPGTGKTMISKAIATNFNCPFVTIPGSGFAQMFIGMDALVVQFLAHKARKLARKWGGQCIVFIDEIDAVGMRRQALQGGSGMVPAPSPQNSIHDYCFYGPYGALNPSGDLIIESQAWRERLFSQRAEHAGMQYGPVLEGVRGRIHKYFPGMGGMGYSGQALNQLLVVMDGMGEPPVVQKFIINRFNTFLDAMFVIPRKIGPIKLRVPTPAPRKEEIYFIGACNVPIESLDPALTRPGRMGRHIWFRTPTVEDRKDIFDLYLHKADHEPELDTEHKRDELARMTNGYSPAMIEQCCSMALTIAHTEGRHAFGRTDILEAMATVETGTAVGVQYVESESRAVAIHEAGHAAASHVFNRDRLISTRLTIRMRGAALGHYMAMEKEERFSKFRGELIGSLITTLGAMAAEHVFYGENSIGVGGDVQHATERAAWMVGACGMGPEPIQFKRTFDTPEQEADARREVRDKLERIGVTIMNRSSGGGMYGENPLGAVLGDRDKRRAAAEILGHAYIVAYCLMQGNRDAIEEIADELVHRRELYGDEVTELLDRVALRAPKVDLLEESTWPTV